MKMYIKDNEIKGTGTWKINSIPWKTRFIWKLHELNRRLHNKLSMLGVPLCSMCYRYGKVRRQRTSYHDDKLNFERYCPKHQKQADEYWDDMWNEYYNSRGL